MPANRKPTAVLEASGAYAKDPKRGRERASEPIPDGPLGQPPADFIRDTPEMKKHLDAWNEIVEIAPPGVLTKSDRQHVKRTAQLMVICDRPNAKSSDRNLLRAHLSDIGCNPVGRTRIHVEHGRKTERSKATTQSQGWAELDHERSGATSRTN